MDPRDLPYSPEALTLLRRKAKAALRTRLKALRAGIPHEARQARSEAITRAVTALDAWRDARTVALFHSMPEEVDTAGLIAAARADHKRIALPVTPDHSAPLSFRLAWDEGFECAFTRGPMGISEPSADAPVVALDAFDLVVVSALGVDPEGFRLGFGRGHYDHTLPLATRAVRVAVAFDFQLIAEVPAEEHDVRVDFVVTDTRCISIPRTETPPR